MDMTGEYSISASREKVWEALNDPDILKASVPGCETLEKVSDTEFTATVMAKVGPVRAKFNGRVTLSDMDPPNGYTISGEGQGGAAGFGKGGAKVSLTTENGETVCVPVDRSRFHRGSGTVQCVLSRSRRQRASGRPRASAVAPRGCCHRVWRCASRRWSRTPEARSPLSLSRP